MIGKKIYCLYGKLFDILSNFLLDIKPIRYMLLELLRIFLHRKLKQREKVDFLRSHRLPTQVPTLHSANLEFYDLPKGHVYNVLGDLSIISLRSS